MAIEIVLGPTADRAWTKLHLLEEDVVRHRQLLAELGCALDSARAHGTASPNDIVASEKFEAKFRAELVDMEAEIARLRLRLS